MILPTLAAIVREEQAKSSKKKRSSRLKAT
jgi:hypothetical protein